MNNTIREIGGVFGVAILASVFAANGGYTSPQAFVDGMVPAVWVGAAVLAVAAVAAAFVPGRSRFQAGAHLPQAPELGGAARTRPDRGARRGLTCARTHPPHARPRAPVDVTDARLGAGAHPCPNPAVAVRRAWC